MHSFITSILLITAESGVFHQNERSYLDGEGFEDIVVHWDGTFEAVKDGSLCKGTVVAGRLGGLHYATCGTHRFRRGHEPVCRPWEIPSCADAARASRVIEDQVNLLAVACLHGDMPACNGWDRSSQDLDPTFTKLYAFGCARGGGQACRRLASMVADAGDIARADALLSFGCGMGSATTCKVHADWLVHRGLDAAATEARARQCALAPESCAPAADES